MMMKGKVLIIDDDPDVLRSMRLLLGKHAERVRTETEPYKIRLILEREQFELILMDMNYASGVTDGKTGLTYLQKIKQYAPQTQVVMMTAFANVPLAVEAMRYGAVDFLIKPFTETQLIESLQRAVQSPEQVTQSIQRTSATPDVFDQIIGTSPRMVEIKRLIQKVGATEANVLITGENGTGKDLVAQALHASSSRKHKAYVAVDMGAIPETLIESELFGHKKGAFTDAREDRIGKMEAAHEGTLFLDELANLSLNAQVKLLTALQSRTIVPLGTHHSQAIDIRLICATNAVLPELVAQKLFRQDLLYRLNTIEIHLPPLRERTEDIAALATHYLTVFSKKYKAGNPLHFAPDTLHKLCNYAWPGNIRELKHTIERAVIMSEEDTLKPDDFILASTAQTNSTSTVNSSINLEELEKQAIYNAIRKHDGNLTKAALELGLGRTTLYRKMERYGL